MVNGAIGAELEPLSRLVGGECLLFCRMDANALQVSRLAGKDTLPEGY